MVPAVIPVPGRAVPYDSRHEPRCSSRGWRVQTCPSSERGFVVGKAEYVVRHPDGEERPHSLAEVCHGCRGVSAVAPTSCPMHSPGHGADVASGG